MKNFAVSTYSPRTILDNMFDDLFDDFRIFPSYTNKIIKSFDLDFIENEKEYSIEIDCPGIKNEQIDISTDDGYLNISMERINEKKDSKGYFERSYGKTSRRFKLPKDSDLDKINGNLKDGILYLTINKLDKVIPKKIEIK